MRLDEAKCRSAEGRLWDSFALEPVEQRVHLKHLDVKVRVQEIGEGHLVVLIHGGSVAGTGWVEGCHHHDGVALMALIVREVVDAARVAPRMRWECPMNRIVMLIFTATGMAAVALAVSPLAKIPKAGVASAVGFWWSRRAKPIGPKASGSRRGFAWLVAGTSVGVAFAIPAIDGGELGEVWWSIFALFRLGGIAKVVIGLTHGFSIRGTPGASE